MSYSSTGVSRHLLLRSLRILELGYSSICMTRWSRDAQANPAVVIGSQPGTAHRSWPGACFHHARTHGLCCHLLGCRLGRASLCTAQLAQQASSNVLCLGCSRAGSAVQQRRDTVFNVVHVSAHSSPHGCCVSSTSLAIDSMEDVFHIPPPALRKQLQP